MLHTGVNEHNEPVNCVPKIGWASSILPTKLGGANPRSMGTADRGWLPPRVDRGSSTEQSASPNKMFTRGQEPDNLRGSGALVQRGSGGVLRRTNCNYVVVLVIAIDVMLLYCAHACTSRLNMCVIVVLTRVVHSVP